MSGIQQFDTSMRLLQRVLDLREKNQEIIGSNIANAETPGYSAKTFSFEDQLQGALFGNDLQPTRTHSSHIPLGPSELEHVTGSVASTKDTTGIGDENNVSVDQEMVKLSQNEIMYEAAITMLNKKLSAVKYAISGGA